MGFCEGASHMELCEDTFLIFFSQEASLLNYKNTQFTFFEYVVVLIYNSIMKLKIRQNIKKVNNSSSFTFLIAVICMYCPLPLFFHICLTEETTVFISGN